MTLALRRLGAAALLTAATVALPATSAAACDPVWERATGYCSRCHFEASTYHTADATAFDLLPDIAWRCAD